jgi:hypothetical protein
MGTGAFNASQLVVVVVILLILVLVVTHVLAVDRHRGGRSIGRGRLPLVVGTTGKRNKRKRDKAGEDQIFNHISLMELALSACIANISTPVERRRDYGVVVVVVVFLVSTTGALVASLVDVVVFRTTTLVATILSPSCV